MTDTESRNPGNGGETHQRAGGNEPVLTTNHGVPVSDNQNSLKSGARGPTLLEDFVLREKIFHFDHERIPERIVHARGSGAHGYFEATADISDLSKAAVFAKGTKTELFARFSTVAGGAGSVDTPRDVRGFAVKFYTTEGNWDLVGNNMPIFFIQDAIKFPDLIHAVKMEADRAFPQAGSAHDTFWDWASLTPEATHMQLWAMSDRAIPRSFRMMEGFGVHTFQLVNAAGEACFVKFHWKPKAGLQSTVWDEAMKLQAADNDYLRRDLWDAIDTGGFPEWEFGIQVFDRAFAEAQPYDVLDATKLIPEEDIPVRIIGRMVLDRNPDNFFAETEQVAFLPTNIVPGIDFSNDPLLQGRLFSYLDTQKSRLGTSNFHQIPINAPRSPAANFQRDGMMQTHVPKGRANYEPNSLALVGEDGGPRETAQGFSTTTTPTGNHEEGEKLRIRAALFGDHHSQARLFWLSGTDSERAHIASAFTFELSKVGMPHVRERSVANLRNVHEDLARRVASGLGIDLPLASKALRPCIDMPPSPALSIQRTMKETLEGRRVGILIADGSEGGTIDAVVSRIQTAGGRAILIAPKIAGAKLADGSLRSVQGQLAGSPSAIFDAVALVLSDDGCSALLQETAAVQWVMDAFSHLKAIAADAAAQPLLDRAGVRKDKGVVALTEIAAAGSTRYWERESSLRTLS